MKSYAPLPVAPDHNATRDISRADRCPLCGQANHCALASSEKMDGGSAGSQATQQAASATNCWCFSTLMDGQQLRLLAEAGKIPSNENERRCICPNCAKQLDELASSDSRLL